MENYRLYLAEYNHLNSQRLELRPITLEDAADIYDYSSRSDNTYYVYPRHESIEETQVIIANYFMADPLGKYGIVLKEENKLIGTIDLRLDPGRASGEIGYIINEDYQGQAYGTEAAQTLLAFAFTVLRLHKVIATCQSNNKASEAVMLKLGMKKEGELRDYERWKEGQWVNRLQYGILQKEYFKQERAKVSKN